MTATEARKAALSRACGVLQSYLDAGSLYEAYGDLPTKDIAKIDAQLTEIIESLSRRLQALQAERRVAG